MQVTEFINKWSKANLSEQAASQEHFLDLCRLLGVKTPAELDPVGDTFTFEKGARVSGPASAGSKGDRGRADVWYKGRLAWEYKRQGKRKTLEAAHPFDRDRRNRDVFVICMGFGLSSRPLWRYSRSYDCSGYISQSEADRRVLHERGCGDIPSGLGDPVSKR